MENQTQITQKVTSQIVKSEIPFSSQCYWILITQDRKLLGLFLEEAAVEQ
jgi:hypothetical protein